MRAKRAQTRPSCKTVTRVAVGSVLGGGMPCNQGACELCVYKYQYKLIVSKEDRSLKESHAGRIARNKVFFLKKLKKRFFSFDLEL